MQINPMCEEFRGGYGTAVDLTPYNNSGNQYTIPADGHICINNYASNYAMAVINGATLVGLTQSSTQICFTTFVKKGMKVYLSTISGSPSVKFLPFV